VAYPGSLFVSGVVKDVGVVVTVLVVFVVMALPPPPTPPPPPPMPPPPPGTFSIGRLENRAESLEKKEDLAAGFIEEVSCVVSAEYAFDAWFLGRFCPEWNVEREGTFRGNALLLLFRLPGVAPPPEVGKTLGLLELVAESPTTLVFSFEEVLAS